MMKNVFRWKNFIKGSKFNTLIKMMLVEEESQINASPHIPLYTIYKPFNTQAYIKVASIIK